MCVFVYTLVFVTNFVFSFLETVFQSTVGEKKAAAVGVGGPSGSGDNALSDLEARLNNLNK